MMDYFSPITFLKNLKWMVFIHNLKPVQIEENIWRHNRVLIVTSRGVWEWIYHLLLSHTSERYPTLLVMGEMYVAAGVASIKIPPLS